MNTLNKSIKRERRTIEAVGLWIVVHRTKDRRQPQIKENDIFQIVAIEATKGGAKCLVCRRRNSDDTCRINSDRFTWEIYTAKAIEIVRDEICNAYLNKLKQCQIDEEKRKHEQSVKKMMQVFSDREQIQVSFVHLVLAELAWQYADYCIYYCKKNKICDVKKLTEKFEKMRDEYDGKFLSQSLDAQMRRNIKKDAKQFSESEAYRDESKWAFDVICDAYSKQYPDDDIKYKLLRVTAQMGRFMVEVYNRQIDKVNKMIDERIGNNRERSAKNIIISEALVDFFDCMQGDFTLEKTPEFERIINKICKFVDNADFRLEGVNL